MKLTPTLWRTCRVLASRRRMKLLKQVFETPGQTVTVLADAVGIPLHVASRYLRDLNARGLLKAERISRYVRYHPDADPSVESSPPLLSALKHVFKAYKRAIDAIHASATAMTHPRRIEIVRCLKQGCHSAADLCRLTRISRFAVRRHLAKLQKRGFVVKTGSGEWQYVRPADRLGGCISDLVD